MKYVLSFIDCLFVLTAIFLMGCGKEKVGSLPLELYGLPTKKSENKEEKTSKTVPSSKVPVSQSPQATNPAPPSKAKVSISDSVGTFGKSGSNFGSEAKLPDELTNTEEPKTAFITIERVCSYKRSNSTAPKYLFFEEATEKKIISMELFSYEESKLKSTVIGNESLNERNLDNAEHRRVNLSYDEKKLLLMSTLEKARSYLEIDICVDNNENGKCSDEPASNHIEFARQRFPLSIPNFDTTVLVLNGRNRLMMSSPEGCERQYSPVILDLDGNGIELSSAEEGVVFDLSNSGRKLVTAWPVGRDDAFLVRDLNRNGKIDNGGELFGNATQLSSGKSSVNGFEAMKELDEDGDRYLTANDKVFGELKLWLDSNSDGITDSGELRSLGEFHIKSLNLNYLESFDKDPYGNELRQQSSFERLVDGVLRIYNMIDVWFRTLKIY